MALPDKDSYAGLGGEKQDYQPAEDPTTDLSAEASNETRTDVAGMTRTVERAFVTIISSGSTPTRVDHDAVWGSDPSVAPTLARIAAGKYTVTWPSTVTDARGNVHAVNLRRGWANAEDNGTNGYVASVTRLSPTSVRVATLSVTGAAYADANVNVTVWVD